MKKQKSGKIRNYTVS